jgi:hypothetical protein
MTDMMQLIRDRINKRTLPPMGNPNLKFQVELTEPEINTIYAFVAFVESACVEAGFGPFWKHYGPTAEHLSSRLSAEFDSPRLQAAQEPEV